MNDSKWHEEILDPELFALMRAEIKDQMLQNVYVIFVKVIKRAEKP